MGKSKKGGVFGYLRGKVGGVTYSIMSAANSKSGKKEQIVRALPDSVANPQTISQVIQRMKSTPAHRFYSALSELLSNAFEGVKYGNASRLHFLSLAMKMNGPYIQKGVDRFIPAVYPFTRGSLPSIGILAFDGGATKFATDVDASAESFAAGLGVSEDTQFTLCIVRNNAGLFTPEYIPFETRMKLSEIPAGGIIKEDSSWKIVPNAFGFDDTNIVAIAVAISKQQADGSWLRSEQDMVISSQLEAQLYSQAAMNAAIASYQDETAANSVNSAWYYNLGLNQAFNGQVVPMVVIFKGNSVRVLVGITQVAGRPQYTIFATSAETTGNIIEVNGRNCVASTTTVADLIAAGITYPVAAYSEAIAIQAGLNDEVTPPFLIHYRDTVAPGDIHKDYACNSEGKFYVFDWLDGGSASLGALNVDSANNKMELVMQNIPEILGWQESDYVKVNVTPTPNDNEEQYHWDVTIEGKNISVDFADNHRWFDMEGITLAPFA